MAGPRDCPNCGLLNPPDGLRCDCGYDFAERQTIVPGGRQVNPAWSGCGTVIGLVLFGTMFGVGSIFACHTDHAKQSGLDFLFRGVFGAVLGFLAGALVAVTVIWWRQRSRR